ncbi:hypothetical protein A3L12_05275 [Thermococcus sp. P6]|uniref:hypothetical protein n=1 Tax=Thermococcus sp. P6 TaxID=122420 RepID=UPI000B59D0AD|nr:hypothetical protein [Thermococcus sp. P6]ASJ10748.1 hypothetical protein A3L12_05275 [Thermococcus sp. P6]
MRWKKVIVLSVVVFVILAIVPASQGVSTRDSPELYSLYYDWLQGKPVGLATFNIEPHLDGKPFTGELIVSVIDYNSPEPRVVLVRRIRGSASVSLKIDRIPVGVQESVQYVNGDYKPVTRTVFRNREYFVSIVGVHGSTLYSGGRFLVFEPRKPVTRLHLSMNLTKKVIGEEAVKKLKESKSKIISDLRSKGITLKESDGILYSATPIDSGADAKPLPAGVIHAAPFTKVEWHISSGVDSEPTGLWYDTFYQNVPYLQDPDPNGWRKGGRKIALANLDDHVVLDNTNCSYYRKREVLATVQYRIDAYYLGPPDWPVIEYVIVPQWIMNLAEGAISMDSVPPVPSYAGTIHQSPTWINFIENTHNTVLKPRDTAWKVQSVTFTFGLGGETIKADVSVTLYRVSGISDPDSKPPYVRVYGAEGAKYWYKNNDKASYEVYFHW